MERKFSRRSNRKPSREIFSDVRKKDFSYNFLDDASNLDWKHFQKTSKYPGLNRAEAKWMSLGEVEKPERWNKKSKDVIPTDYVLSKTKSGGFTTSSFASIESFLPVSTIGNFKSDIIALNNMLPIKNFLGVVRDLELGSMWDMVNTALVECNQVRALVFKVSSQLHMNDLKLLTCWAQTRLENPQLSAAFATREQILEWNAVKRESQKPAGTEGLSYMSFVTARSLKLWKENELEAENTLKSSSCTPELGTMVTSRGSTSSYSHSSRLPVSHSPNHKNDIANISEEFLPTYENKLQADTERGYKRTFDESRKRTVECFSDILNETLFEKPTPFYQPLSEKQTPFSNSSFRSEAYFDFPKSHEKVKECQPVRNSLTTYILNLPYSPKSLSSQISDTGSLVRTTSYTRRQWRPIKCLFIEIRGVMVTTRENYQLPHRLEDMTPKLAKRLLLLKNIVFLSRCKLVLIGTARGKPALLEIINQFFKAWEISPFYSVTASLHKDKLSLEQQRSKEVHNWLDSRYESQGIKSWCVVDVINLNCMNTNGTRRVVRVNPRAGLTRTNVAAILGILGVELELYQ